MVKENAGFNDSRNGNATKAAEFGKKQPAVNDLI